MRMLRAVGNRSRTLDCAFRAEKKQPHPHVHALTASCRSKRKMQLAGFPTVQLAACCNKNPILKMSASRCGRGT